MMHIPVDLIKACADVPKGAELALQFSSTEELPEKARKIIGSEKFDKCYPYNGWTESDKKCVRGLYAVSGIETFLMVPEFCVFHFKARGAGFSKFSEKVLS
jgi:hypothetical protein